MLNPTDDLMHSRCKIKLITHSYDSVTLYECYNELLPHSLSVLSDYPGKLSSTGAAGSGLLLMTEAAVVLWCCGAVVWSGGTNHGISSPPVCFSVYATTNHPSPTWKALNQLQ